MTEKVKNLIDSIHHTIREASIKLLTLGATPNQFLSLPLFPQQAQLCLLRQEVSALFWVTEVTNASGKL